VNYTTYSSITPNTSFNTVAAFAGNGVSLSSSWNPVYKLGAIYNIDDRWSINAGLAYVPLSTNVSLQANPALTGAPNTATAKLTINPTDFTIKVGYKF
jgi:outer membrane protein